MNRWLLISVLILALVGCRGAQSEVSDETQLEQAEQSFCSAVSEIPAAECEALVALYESTDGPNWALKRGWLETAQPCGWAGIQCEEGHVTGLLMNYNDLRGPLPPELEQLPELRTVSLYFNYLSGSLPPELGRLAKLEILILHNNRLEGRIPPELGQLANLKQLDLESNRLSGPIPAELGQLAHLEHLNLKDNQLNGPIPAELGNLAALRGLLLAGNNLSGSVPAELGNLAKLWMFDVSYNDELSGNIPDKLQALPGSGYDFFKWKKGEE
jgi:Leucine-rich repeat (LRR) protein